MQLFSQVQASLVSLAWDSVRLCAWLILLMVIFVPLEKLFALHKQKVFRKSFGADLLFYFVSSLLPKLILIHLSLSSLKPPTISYRRLSTNPLPLGHSCSVLWLGWWWAKSGRIGDIAGRMKTSFFGASIPSITMPKNWIGWFIRAPIR